jgi:DNA mismatch repair protein MSH3
MDLQMAIADATLQYLVEKIRSKTLFITHYPLLATKLQSRFPKDIQNLHMGYEAESRVDGSRSITFLYRLMPGLATGTRNEISTWALKLTKLIESFGIECARMAKVPEKVVSIAAERAVHMQEEVQQRTRRNAYVSWLLQRTQLTPRIDYGKHLISSKNVFQAQVL